MNALSFLKEIEKSNRIGVLTGAGISTDAGIPDFRSPNGIYSTGKYDPVKTFDIEYFKKDPSHFYRFSKELFSLLENAAPTPAHKFLYYLEKENKLLNIITQNIDRLHQKAGNKRVIEIHGGYNKFYCLRCGEEYNIDQVKETILNGKIPYCKCNGVLKPDVVFFQESVKKIEDCIKTAQESDLFLVIGTSLQVQPAGMIPYYAEKVIILNNEFPPFFQHPNYEFIECNLLDFFKEVNHILEK